MTDIKALIREIKRASAGATPGWWDAFMGFGRRRQTLALVKKRKNRRGSIVEIISWSGFDDCDVPNSERVKNLAYIVAAQPKNVLALIDALAESEAARQEAERSVRQMIKKAATKSLDGYREMGQKCAALEAANEKLQAENARLRALVRCLIDLDPNDDAADGVTVLDVWRKEARAALTSKETDDAPR